MCVPVYGRQLGWVQEWVNKNCSFLFLPPWRWCPAECFFFLVCVRLNLGPILTAGTPVFDEKVWQVWNEAEMWAGIENKLGISSVGLFSEILWNIHRFLTPTWRFNDSSVFYSRLWCVAFDDNVIGVEIAMWGLCVYVPCRCVRVVPPKQTRKASFALSTNRDIKRERKELKKKQKEKLIKTNEYTVKWETILYSSDTAELYSAHRNGKVESRSCIRSDVFTFWMWVYRKW